MKRPFLDDGCEVCRTSWLGSYSIDEQVGDDQGYPVYKCRVCGTYWAQTQKWVVAISEEEAQRRLSGERDPEPAWLPDFIELPAHREWPRARGRVVLPDLPLTDVAGKSAGLLWAAEVLTAIADVLDADPSADTYLLKLLRLSASSGPGGASFHRDGYNLLVPGSLDWTLAREHLDPALPGDWGRDPGQGPTVAIGMLAHSYSRSFRGPSEIETVGDGLTGRRRLRARRREFAVWERSIWSTS
jgi:hypothetical protein